MKNNGDLGSFIMGLMAGMAVMAIVFITTEAPRDIEVHKHAVEHGYAKYELDETTGKIEFKWKEKE